MSQSAKANRASKRLKADPPPPSLRKTFQIPATLDLAKSLGLRDSPLLDAQISKIMPHPQSIMVTDADTVPVGHYWKPGPVDGDTMLACYRTKINGCHWVEVPASSPPDWDPHPDDD